MHILLDLVPGHTSEKHAWFTESKKAEPNEYSDRYMWTDGWLCGGAGLNYIAGESPRNGAYIVNFFKCQPALNYGVLNPTERWHKSMYDPACIATREAMKDVCRFWLNKGCDGFRVDMAELPYGRTFSAIYTLNTLSLHLYLSGERLNSQSRPASTWTSISTGWATDITL